MNCGFINIGEQGELLLLLGHTDGTTATAGGLSVLTTHTQTAEKQRGETVSTKTQASVSQYRTVIFNTV